ncbi:uncharacterized protein SETTUDRAFT_52439, partial [Exserohilum turcica Et28A]
MGKTKVADKSSKKDKKAELSSVKAGRVTKPAATPKSKSKDIAKSVASSVKDKKKSKKAPTPEPESDSSSESESEDSSESSSEEEVEKKTSTKPAPKAAPKAVANDSDSSSSESSDDSSSSEDEKPAPKAKTNGAAKTKAESSDSDSDSDSESDSDSSESKDEKPAAKAEATSTSDDSSDSDADSDSDSDSSSESDSDEAEAPSKKRKAEEVTEPAVKKTKTVEPVAEEGIKNLFVGNMSWNIDEDWLRREFEGFGEIVGCRVITDRETGRAKGFGYVEFANAADAAKAQKEMHDYELDGRPLNVDFSTPRQKPDANAAGARANKFGDKRSPASNTLFLGNISFECTNDSIQQIFAEYGNITRVSLPTDRDTGSLKGFGYVDFSTQEEATAALEALNGQDIEGRAIRIDYATPRDDNGG